MIFTKLLGEVGIEWIVLFLLDTDIHNDVDYLPLLLILQSKSQQLLKSINKVLHRIMNRLIGLQITDSDLNRQAPGIRTTAAALNNTDNCPLDFLY